MHAWFINRQDRKCLTEVCEGGENYYPHIEAQKSALLSNEWCIAARKRKRANCLHQVASIPPKICGLQSAVSAAKKKKLLTRLIKRRVG